MDRDHFPVTNPIRHKTKPQAPLKMNDFRILIPTRNRQKILMDTLACYCDQGINRVFDIVVSDNSDEAAYNVETFCKNNNISYIRPPRVMSMTSHWAWVCEGHADNGMVLMSDRSIPRKDLLIAACEMAEAANLPVTYANDTLGNCVIGKLAVLKGAVRTNEFYYIESNRFIELALDLMFPISLPRLLNCALPSGVVKHLSKKNIFKLDSISPDFEFCFKYLTSGLAVLYYDANVFTSHSIYASNGSAAKSGRENSAFLDFKRLTLTIPAFSPNPDDLSVNSFISHEFNRAFETTGIRIAKCTLSHSKNAKTSLCIRAISIFMDIAARRKYIKLATVRKRYSLIYRPTLLLSPLDMGNKFG